MDSDRFTAISMQADKLGAKLYFLLEKVEERAKERDVMVYSLGRKSVKSYNSQ